MLAVADNLVTLAAALGGAFIGGGAAIVATAWERRAERREARADRVRDAILDAQAKAIAIYRLAKERPAGLQLLLDRAEGELGQARTALFLDPFVEDPKLGDALRDCWKVTDALALAARSGSPAKGDFDAFDQVYDALTAEARRYLFDLVG